MGALFDAVRDTVAAGLQLVGLSWIVGLANWITMFLAFGAGMIMLAAVEFYMTVADRRAGVQEPEAHRYLPRTYTRGNLLGYGMLALPFLLALWAIGRLDGVPRAFGMAAAILAGFTITLWQEARKMRTGAIPRETMKLRAALCFAAAVACLHVGLLLGNPNLPWFLFWVTIAAAVVAIAWPLKIWRLLRALKYLETLPRVPVGPMAALRETPPPTASSNSDRKGRVRK